MLNFPLVDGLLSRAFPAIVVNCSAFYQFEARNV
ncbi:virulence promoting factor [Erwinia sp. ErVv1]